MKTLAEIKNGETFWLEDIKFIKFYDDDGASIVMSRMPLVRCIFGDSNKFDESEIFKALNTHTLPKIEEIVGAENILPFVTDLTTADGSSAYGIITSKISIPTLDFYRENIKIFDKYNGRDVFWLATAWSAPPHHRYSRFVLRVFEWGDMDYCNCDEYRAAVLPILHLKSSVEVEEKPPMELRGKLE